MATMTINTSGPICSVAIMNQNNTIYYEENTLHNQHSESLFKIIHTLLERSNHSYNTIKNLAVVVGPGSFTGVRVGIAAAQGIHLASKIPLHGISTLEIQAYLILTSTTTKDKEILSVIEVSPKTLYSQTFNNKLVALSKIQILDKNNFSDYLPNQNIIHITSNNINARTAALLYKYKIENNLPTLNPIPIYFNTIY
ncbi:tRNA (adenosine(37)-N6)-threonylcarbamoyltransferase complex dimerization subunit type 1 TsaB [Ehrlichia ruminantium]|uniref:tRNA (Adenosine(37)-N6)-threonylcarbamoyltransferase complex dimerization subunit type 1 TsaB n=1 Tax=Ehrlichia ruminantium TaxID=779 RepID=A0AAE6UJG3_EHRRU|nr:tRNA (adenosine(37)-N6)-threonylcarbamoyltransferase complex dimerization subunit type 1 TsaB [Ehrlichia ruminantium]QGR02422.1 tRNA (adenosine(37)-N6)-threonylcarbamoyltransferase complex dimerization subunit type 1 TsaB [Ehrlichia ruminantium]QGR03341.1 tRNA (adenosine(37)-N6)-threonylcarbamoyltransferase complex dimerization subunit type 1 TsaB [Ehrlichia ruminantium]QGR04268.1 tRNA (adenosine(37)-N6)-threonylcarbamoyltransferase complex dimerization subunit type 1 TsaB [Ehrlichia ruminant